MKKIKSYTSIWNVEKVLYSLSDLQLPFPVTFTQIAWFVAVLFIVIMFGDLPPLSLTDNVLIKYLVFPVGITWFMSKKAFDGKKPYGFLKSAIAFMLRPKLTYAGKPVKLKREKMSEVITTVRSEIYVPD